MKKLLIIIVAVVSHCQAFAAQQNLNYSTRSYWNVEGPKVQANTTELYTTKANKASTVMLWSEWPDGASFTTSSPIVQYNGTLYKCTAPYTKTAGATPDTLTEYFAEVSGSGGIGDDLGSATATDVAALFSGTGTYLKKDGTSGTPPDTDDQAATEVPITDSAGYYTATNVETVLQEIGAWPALTVETTPTTGDNKVPASSYVLGFDSDADGIVNKVEVAVGSKSADYTIGTDSANELYGGTIYVSSAATITAPAVGAGMNFSVVTIGAVTVSLDVNASDRIILDGTALADGDKATNTSTAGDTIYCQYQSADGWFCWSGSPDGDHWTDGN